jgi:hypothetical protein
MSDMWEEIIVRPSKEDVMAEVTYLLYRLQMLGEPKDRIRAYRDKIEQMLSEVRDD